MGSRTPDGESGPIPSILEDLRRRISTLETPTGTSLRSLVDQVKAALANINTTVANAIAANSYTKTEIDSRIAAPPAGSAVTGDITSTGGISSSGLLNAGGIATLNAGIISTDVRSRVLSVGYAAVYSDSTGRQGISPSSKRFKKDISTWRPDIVELLKLRAVMFRYKVEIDDNPAQPKQIGFIAEELVALGFSEFIFYDAEGLVQGINYDRMVVALLELAKYEHDRLTGIEDRLTAAGF